MNISQNGNDTDLVVDVEELFEDTVLTIHLKNFDVPDFVEDLVHMVTKQINNFVEPFELNIIFDGE
jgi:hypothetical protein